jgi:hypothetical protein
MFPNSSNSVTLSLIRREHLSIAHLQPKSMGRSIIYFKLWASASSGLAPGAILQVLSRGAGPVGYYFKVLKGVLLIGRFVPGRSVPGSRFWVLVSGISFLGSYFWDLISGFSFLGSRFWVLVSGPRFWAFCSWILVLGSSFWAVCCWVFRSWILIPGVRVLGVMLIGSPRRQLQVLGALGALGEAPLSQPPDALDLL